MIFHWMSGSDPKVNNVIRNQLKDDVTKLEARFSTFKGGTLRPLKEGGVDWQIRFCSEVCP